MKRLTVAIVFTMPLLIFASPSEGNEIDCPKLQPITVRWLQGRVLSMIRKPIAKANVELLSNKAVLASVQTTDDGTFSFKNIKAGNYELRVRSPQGLGTVQYPVVLEKPTSDWKGFVEMTAYLGYLACGGARIVN